MQWPSSTRIQFTLPRKATIVVIDLSFQDEGVIDLVSSESSSEAIDLPSASKAVRSIMVDQTCCQQAQQAGHWFNDTYEAGCILNDCFFQAFVCTIGSGRSRGVNPSHTWLDVTSMILCFYVFCV
jgi:hypothetical protein